MVADGGASPSPHPAAPRSCATLPKSCGASGHEDCCETLYVPGGTFLRSYDGVRWTDDRYPATVSPFWLDRYEVTTERFSLFQQAWPSSKPAVGAGAHPLIWNSGWQASFNQALPYDQKTFTDQLSYCGNGTYFSQSNYGPHRPMSCLPWTSPSASGTVAASRRRPSGTSRPPAAASSASTPGPRRRARRPSTPPRPPIRRRWSSTSACTRPAPAAGATRISSATSASSCATGAGSYPVPCVDCLQSTGGFPVLRGGNAFVGPSNLDVSARWNTAGAWNSASFGFRCARDAAPAP